MLASLLWILAANDDTGEKLAIGGGSAGLTALVMKLWSWYGEMRMQPESATRTHVNGERLAVTETRLQSLAERLDRHELLVAERFEGMERLVREGFDRIGERFDRLTDDVRHTR